MSVFTRTMPSPSRLCMAVVGQLRVQMGSAQWLHEIDKV
ncbi:hypothetical protein BN128_825 [Cronobacter sakazakii 696]|nr:hypothetical protein BN128_825 [Cronobacter sakazakii 696]